MRLDFNVLWVDDQPHHVEAQAIPIEDRMARDGFALKRRLCETMEQLQAALGANMFTDEVDLILVDWDLGAALKGEQVISAIREKIQYREVIFYSAQTEPGELRKKAFEAGLEGVYCATREHLVDEVIAVFESLVKKVLDLDHARGIVMGATSDIDAMILECLDILRGGLDEGGKKAMLEHAFERLDDRAKDLGKKIKKLKEQAEIEAVLKEHGIIGSNDRLRFLLRVLEAGTTEVHISGAKSAREYMKNVVPKRNDYGHIVLVPTGKPNVVAGIDGMEVSLEDVRELRRVLLRLRSEFTALRAGLKGKA